MLGLACSYIDANKCKEWKVFLKKKSINTSIFLCHVKVCSLIILYLHLNCRCKYKILKVNLYCNNFIFLNCGNMLVLWQSFIPYKPNCFLYWSLTVYLLENCPRSLCTVPNATKYKRVSNCVYT